MEYIDEETVPYINNKIRKYIKNDELRNTFELVRGPDSYLRDDEMTVYRCIINCKTKDIKCRELLKALGNQDMGLKPSFSDYAIFIHNEKEIAYNLYDDRGLDLNSWNKENREFTWSRGKTISPSCISKIIIHIVFKRGKEYGGF